MRKQSLRTRRITGRLQSIGCGSDLGDVTSKTASRESCGKERVVKALDISERSTIVNRITQLLQQAGPYELKIILQFVLHVLK